MQDVVVLNPIEISNPTSRPIPVDFMHGLIGPTYDASFVFTAGAAATDVFTITGVAGKVLRLLHASQTGTQTTTSVATVDLIRRSTPNSGGSSTVVTAVPTDSQFPAAAATVRAYTANPTAGTLVGLIQTDKAAITDTSGVRVLNPSQFLSYENDIIPIAIIREGEVVAINLAGQTLVGNSLSCHFRWQELDV